MRVIDRSGNFREIKYVRIRSTSYFVSETRSLRKLFYGVAGPRFTTFYFDPMHAFARYNAKPASTQELEDWVERRKVFEESLAAWYERRAAILAAPETYLQNQHSQVISTSADTDPAETIVFA